MNIANILTKAENITVHQNSSKFDQKSNDLFERDVSMTAFVIEGGSLGSRGPQLNPQV